MAKINPKVLREAQLIMLEMLVEFDRICKKHNLQYWLDSGTLLGAVRHKGFIPWDDDIDLSMPLEDYSKFIQIAQDELPDSIFFQTTKTDGSFPFDYIKLRSQKAEIVEFHEKDRDVAYHQGVFVDIFPMLTIPNSEFHQQFYMDIFKLIRSVSSVSLHTPEGKNRPLEREKLIATLALMHQGWQKEDSKIIYGGEMPDVAAWFDYQSIFPLKKMEFEGLEFSVPNDPDHYLGAIYSFDYMELPPLDKRATHAEEMRIVDIF
ncbi:LicD family protein [Sulfurovum sp. bin170]|uniref:LicD family protein n=1 Tax=Sulfurovum sp. bin170 TaxID=2695268 RepID=UPI0013DF5377|nr:LicD family protein [Sulfurovum sp. bin170]NEW60801.1 LicD family protein [Sulfurovum sp. bin170]